MSLQKPGPFLVLILYLHQVNRRKREARESALPTNFEQSKEKNYPPTSLVTLLCIFCVLGRAHSCALCAPSGRRGESRRAGDGNPALLLLCSNWPQQPAAASRSDFLRRSSEKNASDCRPKVFPRYCPRPLVHWLDPIRRVVFGCPTYGFGVIEVVFL